MTYHPEDDWRVSSLWSETDACTASSISSDLRWSALSPWWRQRQPNTWSTDIFSVLSWPGTRSQVPQPASRFDDLPEGPAGPSRESVIYYKPGSHCPDSEGCRCWRGPTAARASGHSDPPCQRRSPQTQAPRKPTKGQPCRQGSLVVSLSRPRLQPVCTDTLYV